MGRASRARPRRLPEKLLSIRKALGLTREVLLDKLCDLMPEGNRPKVHAQNISAYEKEEREPSLITLLAYAKLARIHLEVLVDDELDLPERLQAGAKSGTSWRRPRRKS